MNETEWVVYRLGGEHSGFLDKASAEAWDDFIKQEAERGNEVNLTLLARGLTHKQAKQFVELTKESTE